MYDNYIGATIYVDKYWEKRATKDPQSLIRLSEAIIKNDEFVKNKCYYNKKELENNKNIVKYTLNKHRCLNILNITKIGDDK